MPSIVDSAGVAVAPPPRPERRDADRFRSGEVHRRNESWLTVLRALKRSKRETAKLLGVPWETFREAIASAEAREREAGSAPGAVATVPGTDLTTDDLVYLQETYPAGTAIGDDPLVRRFFARIDVDHLTRGEVADRRRRLRLERAAIVGEVA